MRRLRPIVTEISRPDRVPWIVPAVLISASAASILSTDLYTPSLPHLPAYFGTDAASVQLTLSLNVLGFAVAQLFYGPLSDRFGRRPVLLLGMLGFLVCSLVCALAVSIDMLIVARVLQGITAATEAVVALAVIRDLYDDEGGVRILAMYGMVVALAPAVGPVIGGHVHVWQGWRANFILLALLAVVVIVLIWRFLPETTVPDRSALRPGRLVRDYWALLRRPQYLTNALVLAAMLGALFAFVTAGPFILIDRLGIRTEDFGYYQAVIVVTFFFGSLAANRGIDRLGVDGMLRVGLVPALLGGLGFPLVLAVELESGWAITAAMSLYAFGLGLIFATAPVVALGAAPGGRGVSAALLGTLEMGGAALGAMTVTVLHDGSSWPAAITVAVFCVLAMVSYWLGSRWKLAA